MVGRFAAEEVPEVYARWLAGQPLAERSKREYLRNVKAFCGWLAGVEGEGWGGDPLRDPLARDYDAVVVRRERVCLAWLRGRGTRGRS